MRALELRFDGSRRAIETNRALVTAEAGVPVLLEGALDELGYLPRVTDLYLDEIEAMTSASVARTLRANGLQRMHDYLAPDQAAELIPRLHARALDLSVPLVRALTEATTAPPRPHYFICARTWIRAAMPYRLVERYPELLQAGHLGGHLLPVTPHRDIDVTMPHNSLSLWSAVGPVREGNTLSVFEGSQPDPARSIRPSLAPGDMLVFNGDCLHASVRNDTDETRVGIGNRVVLGRRLRFGSGTHWRLWYDASMLDTPLAPLATLQSRLSRAALRRWRWKREWTKEQAKQQRASAPAAAS
jgi:hypothetical protein